MYPLQKGRPADESGRLPLEIACYDLLDSLNISYERIDHEAAFTMEQCALVDESLNAMICKNLFLTNRPRSAFYLLMIPADKAFKTGIVSKQIGSSRLEFAPPDCMEKILKTSPGSASILSLMHDKDNRVTLLVDRDILKSHTFGCHPCINTSSLKMKTEDVFGPLLKALKHEPVMINL